MTDHPQPEDVHGYDQHLDSLSTGTIETRQLEAVHQTLNGVGAPTRDAEGRKLNANGRLVDWLEQARGREGEWGRAAGQYRAEAKQLRQALIRIKSKGDGTWSADRCAVEAEMALALLERSVD